MYILGIETSCDETSVAVVKDGRQVISNIVSSQIKQHKQYGGVVPEVASRMHAEAINPVIEIALKEANLTLQDIDLIAATKGPGLFGALMVGMCSAKALAYGLDKPYIGVHHIEGHILANYLDNEEEILYPSLALVISGGHTQLVLIEELGKYQLIGNTLDDAVGEAFDKTARYLGLGYPGGPVVDKLAKLGNPKAIRFPKVNVQGEYDFSFSGLKTAAMQLSAEHCIDKLAQDDQKFLDFIASFQSALVKQLLEQTQKALNKYSVKSLLLAGGVSANSAIREAFLGLAPKHKVLIPPLKFCTDNAAMIAIAGYYNYQKFGPSQLDLLPKANLPLY